MNEQICKFQLKSLPYDYDALEPYIDQETVRIHHDKHLQTYVDNLNKALENHPNYYQWSLEKLITDNECLPSDIRTAVRNNAGGVYNHNFYFNIMTPNSTKEPIQNLKKAINDCFGSFNNFKINLKNAALGQFGSGWAWLVGDKSGNLKIISTPNQETPLTENLFPIILVDVWEHAYYLQYQNRRADYLDNWFNVIDWEVAEENFNNYLNSINCCK